MIIFFSTCHSPHAGVIGQGPWYIDAGQNPAQAAAAADAESAFQCRTSSEYNTHFILILFDVVLFSCC